MSHTQFVATAVLAERPGVQPAAAPPAPEITGYQLRERIGLGGYGEVWKAVGPGGFLKAVKILYGHMDGPQAETELKSLNLMRELRHPFLLNVERVEFIQGRLVVVTELADHSLDQRFAQAVAAGSRGIPRDELLTYLRDVADALDFMSEHHGLQHLDIKPENLLIQGSHAKVGDFGLTKHVGLSQASMVNGFTPLYAPPELFEGQPSSNSDQYSLAIVYQMMLTGVPPYNGRTAAQLTSQHLRGTPDLTPLPTSDRALVARALSRNPAHRFPGCRQFIDLLARRRPSAGSSIRSLNAAAAGATEGSVSGLTQMVDPATVGKSASTPLRPAQPLPPLPATDCVFRPTLFIAVGGLGTRIAARLQQRLQSHLGCVPPVYAFLNIDSDRQALSSNLRSDPDHAGLISEALPIPLRTPQEYRKQASEHLSWLSRRWLFNIPRSGQVEGMRPLGRLVFVDHQDRIRDSIQRMLRLITDKSALAAAAAGTGHTFATDATDAVDVCLIGSTSGGTASGCLADLGFLTRHILNRNGLPTSHISALLLHSTSIGGQRSDAQDANSVSFLQELHHYGLSGLQRTTTTRTTSVPAGHPFDTSIFVHLGDDLTTQHLEKQLDHISSYLVTWAASPDRAILESWRMAEQEHQPELHAGTVRTLGCATTDGSTWNTASAEAEGLALQLVRHWLESDVPASSSPATERRHNPGGTDTHNSHAALLEALSLQPEQILRLVPGLLGGDISRRIDAYAADVWRRLSQPSAQFGQPSDFVDRLAGTLSADATAGAQATDSAARITQTVRQELNSRLQQSCTRLRARVLQDLDSPQRLQAAGHTLQVCLQQLDDATAACTAQQADVQQTFAALCSGMLQPADPSAAPTSAALRAFSQQYCMLLICQTVCQCVIGHLQNLREFAQKLQQDTTADYRSVLLQLVTALHRSSGQPSRIPAELLEAFEQSVQSSGHFTVSAVLRNPQAAARHAAMLTAQATSFLFSARVHSHAQHNAEAAQPRASLPQDAHPQLSNVGGGRRVLA